jgi:sporulation and spore germination protein/immunoglobulin-like protein involved in spore germination
MSIRTAAVVCTCLLAAGCGGSGAVVVGSGQGPRPPAIASVATVESSGGGSVAPVTGQTPAKLGVEVWLVRAGRLYPVTRGVQATRAVIGAAVRALLAGPAGTGATSAVPAGTQLLGISLHGGVATVDLTSDFTSGGSAASERLRLAQLVYTVTQFHGVHGVRLHLDGSPATALSDGLVLADPMTRRSMGFADLAPAISVTSPRPGARVQAPFTVRGVADVFEAGLTFKLLDAQGHELGSGASSASCGTGCPGTFSFPFDEIGVSRIQRGTLVVSSANASGLPGGGEHVRVPLVLLPPFDVTSPLPGATLTSPATIAVNQGVAGDVLIRIADSHLHILARKVVHDVCVGCPGRAMGPAFRIHLPFSVAGLQNGYVVVSPLHMNRDRGGQVVEIPVTLNGG